MFEIPHVTNFLEYPPCNGGAFLLVGTKVVESWEFVESFLSGDDIEILIWSIIDVIISVSSYVSFSIFSSYSFLLD